MISKKQFFILSAIIVILTIAIVVWIVNSDDKNNDNDIKNNDISDVQNDVSDNDNGDDNQNDEKEQTENENNQDITDEYEQKQEEIIIDTDNNISEELQNIKQRAEVVTNKEDELIFEDMFTPTKEEIEGFIGVDLSIMDSYIVRMSNDKFSSELYMIFKPFEQDMENAKGQVKKFILAYEDAWEKLSKEQYELVKNRTAVQKGDYLIYIISDENETIMGEVRKYI